MGYLLGYLRNICGICVGIEWDIRARDSLAHVPAIQPQNILKPPSISSITKPSGVPGYPTLFNFKPILGQFDVFNKHPNDNNSEMLFNQVS